VNVTIPAGFTSIAVVSQTPPPGKTWSAPALVGSTLQLRNPGPNNSQALDPGQVLSVTVTTKAPAATGTYCLTTQAKQSNDFSGPPGNGFTRSGADPCITVLSTQLDHFVVAAIGKQKAGVPFAGFTVTAYDTSNNIKTDYAGGPTFVLSGLGTSPAPVSKAPSTGTVSWSNGVGTVSGMTDYRAEATQLTAKDTSCPTNPAPPGNCTGTSSSFVVAPGDLDHFAFSSIASPQTAGQGFALTVTALDAWANVKTDDPGLVTVSGLGNSPSGCTSGGVPGAPFTFPCPPSYGLSWSSGQGSGTVTPYKAETNVHLTASEGSVSSGSSSFDVTPGPLARFSFATIPGQTAGNAFGATFTASDAFGNVKTGYRGGPSFTLSGLGTSPAPVSKQPAYGSVSWSNGVGTVTGVTDYRAETTTLTATDTALGKAGSSNAFTVVPGSLSTLTFSQQPTETEKQKSITPAPTATATDAWGNTISGVTVNVALTVVSGSGTFTPSSTTTATTDASGVATFVNLAVTSSGEYALVATSGSATTTSLGFVIADKINPCSGSCPPTSGSVKNNVTTTATATGAAAGTSLAVAVILNTAPPPGVCGDKTTLGAGSIVNILSTGGATPTFTITWTLDKSIVNQVPDNGASKFDLCVGAENLLDPSGGSTTGWTTKNGTPAVPVFDPVLGVTLFWGVAPDCPNQGTPTGPCVLSKHKTQAGDEIITLLKPPPWDGRLYGQ
jgi:hypothetical protein